ncbi:MAG: DUF362 domain-containing protein, partial [Candidatus Woesearchaeota archaeon]
LVAAIKTNPQKILQDYGRLMELADYQKTLSKSRATILKLNLSWSMYYPACSTEPWQLEGVVKKLQNDGYHELHPVENRTVVTDVWKGAKGNKWLPILKKYNLKYEPLTETKWVNYKPKANMFALEKVFSPKYGTKHRAFAKPHQIPAMFIGKDIVHLPTLKTHGHTTMTGAMKNAFGGLITTRRHHCHKQIHEVLVDLLQIQQEIHPGIFAVMDGTVAGDGAGPRTMLPKIKNTILASGDQVAIDAVAAHLMGFDPMKIGFIKLAHDLNLGCGDIDQIDFAGLSRKEILKTNFHFSTGKSPVIFWDQMFRKGMLSFVEPLLFHTGLFNLAVFASAFYHDNVWYNLVGRSRINRFNQTPWGKLWMRY